jgi:hypothetical protein
MADESEKLMFQVLPRMDSNISELRDGVWELKGRMTHVEEGFAGVNRRIDGLEAPLDRIERRFELTDAAR